MRKLILTAAAAASTVVAVSPAVGQQWRWNEGNWRTVAYRQVDGRDTDTINLRGHIRERAIRVCALRQPLNLRDFDIRYQNGGHQDVNTRAVLQPGTCTRAIDLRGRNRDIRSVRLRYAPIVHSWLRPAVRIQVR